MSIMKSDADSRLEASNEADVRAHLERILASKAMTRSQSLTRFLRFVVEETLAGRGKRLTARVVATNALGRAKDFDPRADPIVSIQASRLRRALQAYYQQDGRSEPIRITIPKGSYRAKFERAESLLAAGELDAKSLAGFGPCVAVVPIVDLNGSADEEYFSVGLTQELVAAIAAFRELNVIAAPSLAAGEPIANTASRLGQEAGARFVLSGSLHRTDTRLVLRVQLTDATSAAVIWTEKIARDLTAAELLDLEEDVAQHVARTVAENYGVIPRALTGEVHAKRTGELSVYDAILRFRYYQCSVTNEARDHAIAALEDAVRLDPKCALAWAMLSEAVCDAYGLRIDCRREVVSHAKELARRAVALDPNCQHAHWALAYSCFHGRERARFLRSAEATIELNPNNGYLIGISAWAMALVGEWTRGLSMLERLMKQNPYYPGWFHLAPYLDHYRKSEFEAALNHAERFNIPSLAWDPMLRASALGAIGRESEAANAWDELASRFPEAAATPAHDLGGSIFIDELRDQVMDGLRKAGLDETKSAVYRAAQ